MTSPRTQDSPATYAVVGFAVVAALGGFLFGFDTSVINGAVDAVQGDYDLSSFVIGLVVAVALLGSAVGAWYAGPAADRFGRPRVMQAAAVLFAASAVGSAFAFSVWDLTVWRVVGGLGVGIASVIAPAYIAEVAPAHLRGRLGSLQQLAIVLGILAALLSDALLAGVADGAAEQLGPLTAWRWMFLVGLLPALAYGLLSTRIPESPRFLVASGKVPAATAVLHRVLGPGVDVDKRVEDIRRTVRQDRRASLADLRGPVAGLMPIVWIGILLSVFQQAVGINVIFYYSTTLWRSVGFSESAALTTSVITGVTNVVVTFVAIALVDRVGRRPLLLAGSAGMVASLATLAVSFTQSTGSGDSVSLPDPWGPVALVAANVFVVSFGATWGPVVWVLLGEVFSNALRGPALAVAAAAQWIANFAITTTFPPLADLGLPFAYGLYTVMSLLSLLFVARFVPETRGRELEDMDDLLGRSEPYPSDAGAPAPTTA